MTRNKTTVGGPAARIDWAAIHRRMHEALDGAERKISAEQTAQILKARAKAMARAPAQDESSAEHIELVEFLLAYERYAVDSSLVREVYPLKDITPLPGTPEFVAGIINVRGQIVSVIDPKKFFDLPDRGIADFHRVVILSDGHMELGLLVDAVIGVQRLSARQIQPPLPTLTGTRAEYLRGVTVQRLMILDAAKILADPKIIVRAES